MIRKIRNKEAGGALFLGAYGLKTASMSQRELFGPENF